MLYTTPKEFERIKRIVDYCYADEEKHYCECYPDEADLIEMGGKPSRKNKEHIFYDLFFMNKAVERVLKSKTNGC